MTGDAWIERVANLHVHSRYSDGTADVPEIARAAGEAGVDVVIISDHNVLRSEEEGWHGNTLVLMGEELHNPARPHENHLLIWGSGEELLPYTDRLQDAIDAALRCGAMAVIAHPIEHSGAAANEPEINWVDRGVTGLHGIELWNYMSEFKSHVHTMLHGLVYAYAPALAIEGPYPETIRLWDDLLRSAKVYAFAGSDAHGQLYRLGPLRRAVLSYRYLFTAMNMHLLLAGAWTGQARTDAALVHEALAHGRGFIGYDRISPTRGTRLVAERGAHRCTFGGTLSGTGEARVTVSLPARAHIELLRNGSVVARGTGTRLEYATTDQGVYRFEARRRYLGLIRGWVFGNPVWIE